MRRGIVTLAMLGITTLAACGGGGTTTPPVTLPSTQPGPSSQPSSSPTTQPTSSPTTQPTTQPTTSPTTQPTSAPQGNAPVIDTVGGSPAYVDPASHHTLYYIDGDTPPGTACPAGCTSEWPLMSPTAGSQPTGKLVIVTRTDGTKQWSENGHGLYHFIGDSGPDQMNGVYTPWHVARP